ncbi:MAG: hypothetical protein ACKVRN_04730 [Pyrinomonadaceae bacterium]
MKTTISIAIFIAALLFCNGCGSDDTKWKTISASPDSNSKSMTTSDENKKIGGGFTANLPDGFQQPSDDAGKRLLREYGAVFVARGGAVPPNVVVFKDESEVSAFQAKAGSSRETISGVSIELQPAAMATLKKAVADANESGVTITPRGSDAAKRSYQDTVELWASRVKPGLTHWTSQGRISSADAARISALSPYEQVPEIFKLEAQGIYFAKDLSKSIIYSVAPPGSSQHLSMLALDVTEHDNSQVRSILAKHGWFQTVESDLPHFTFLGVPQTDLPKLGLKKVSHSGRVFWVPEI